MEKVKESISPHRHWRETFSPSYGTCYTFNSGRRSEEVRKASLTGVSNGLSIEMFIDQTNYMINKLSKRAGMRLVLHDPKTPPLPEEEGLDLAPNTASSVAVQMVTLTTGMSQREMTRLRDLTPAV